jgi:hypothetical protein
MNVKIIKMWLVRFAGASLIVFVVLKFSESWIFDWSDSDNPSKDPKHREHSIDDVEIDPLVLLRRHERTYFANHPEPRLRNRRCDACRIVAHHFDVAFEMAEEQLLGTVKSHVL